MSIRKAVLGFIAQLNVSELPLFFQLLIKSLQISEPGKDGTEICGVSSMNEVDSLNVLSHFTMERILAIPWKKKQGFLHVVEEVLRIFDASRVSPFLDLLLGCVVRVLESCALNIPNGSYKKHGQLDDSSEITIAEGEKEVSHQYQLWKYQSIVVYFFLLKFTY